MEVAMGRDAGREEVDAQQRLRAWEANKHKHPDNTEWWRDFYLSPSHARGKAEGQELIRKAAEIIASEQTEAKEPANRDAKRWEIINKSPEARASRRADGLRLLSLNLGHLGVVFLLL